MVDYQVKSLRRPDDHKLRKYIEKGTAQTRFVLETKSFLQRLLTKAKSELGLSNHHSSSQKHTNGSETPKEQNTALRHKSNSTNKQWVTKNKKQNKTKKTQIPKPTFLATVTPRHKKLTYQPKNNMEVGEKGESLKTVSTSDGGTYRAPATSLAWLGKP